ITFGGWMFPNPRLLSICRANRFVTSPSNRSGRRRSRRSSSSRGRITLLRSSWRLPSRRRGRHAAVVVAEVQEAEAIAVAGLFDRALDDGGVIHQVRTGKQG